MVVVVVVEVAAAVVVVVVSSGHIFLSAPALRVDGVVACEIGTQAPLHLPPESSILVGEAPADVAPASAYCREARSSHARPSGREHHPQVSPPATKHIPHPSTNAPRDGGRSVGQDTVGVRMGAALARPHQGLENTFRRVPLPGDLRVTVKFAVLSRGHTVRTGTAGLGADNSDVQSSLSIGHGGLRKQISWARAGLTFGKATHLQAARAVNFDESVKEDAGHSIVPSGALSLGATRRVSQLGVDWLPTLGAKEGIGHYVRTQTQLESKSEILFGQHRAPREIKALQPRVIDRGIAQLVQSA